MVKQFNMPLVLWSALWMSYASTVLGADCSNQLSPILFVPGLMGSQIKARIQGSPEGLLCDSDGFDLMWINEEKIIEGDLGIGCFEYGLTLQFEGGNNYSPRCGVDTKVSGAAGTDTEAVEYLDSFDLITYGRDFVNYFVARGYVRDFSIRAVPYDWRFAADNLRRQGYYSQMQGVIEQMYEQNNQTKVTVVVHSMGGPVSLYFLNNIVDQVWKDQYINAYVPLSGAWDGGLTMLQSLISGVGVDNEVGNLFITPRLWRELRDLFRTFQGNFWLLPSADSLDSLVVAQVGNDTYTASQYIALFQRAGITDGFTKYTNVKAINAGWPAPNVPTHCFYGLFPTKNNTPETFIYATEDFPNREPTLIRNGLGDTSVNAKVSEICLRWMNQTANFTSQTFEVTHTEMLVDAGVLAAIGQIVGAPADPTPSISPPSGSIFSAIMATLFIGIIMLAVLTTIV